MTPRLDMSELLCGIEEIVLHIPGIVFLLRPDFLRDASDADGAGATPPGVSEDELCTDVSKSSSAFLILHTPVSPSKVKAGLYHDWSLQGS